MNLPVAFQNKYRRLLGDEADAFLASFDEPSTSGFRSNPLKNGQPQATINNHLAECRMFRLDIMDP